jgi:hypothetical protein
MTNRDTKWAQESIEIIEDSVYIRLETESKRQALILKLNFNPMEADVNTLIDQCEVFNLILEPFIAAALDSMG